MNIYQNAVTEIDFQIFVDNNTPKDLTNVTKVVIDVAVKESRKKILSIEGAISATPADGKMKFIIGEDAVSKLTPEDVDIAFNKYKPTQTLYGYISLYSDGVVTDKIFIENISLYFDMVE